MWLYYDVSQKCAQLAAWYLRSDAGAISLSQDGSRSVIYSALSNVKRSRAKKTQKKGRVFKTIQRMVGAQCHVVKRLAVKSSDKFRENIFYPKASNPRT